MFNIHLDPLSTGHPACTECRSLKPADRISYQKAAAPFLGAILPSYPRMEMPFLSSILSLSNLKLWKILLDYLSLYKN